jgi:ssDNA-binding Zn-finger/Zn-ribbon topoisomerase 1
MKNMKTTHTPLKDKVAEMACPKCGKKMESGFVAAKGMRLRWVNNPDTKTIFAGEQLTIPFSWWSAPSYEALRCADCGLVLMNYDPKKTK